MSFTYVVAVTAQTVLVHAHKLTTGNVHCHKINLHQTILYVYANLTIYTMSIQCWMAGRCEGEHDLTGSFDHTGLTSAYYTWV